MDVKCHKRVLQCKLSSRLKGLLSQAAEINSLWIEELSIQKDHIHILIQINPTISLAKVVQILKGGTSRIIGSEFPLLEEFLGRWIFFQKHLVYEMRKWSEDI